MSFDPSEPQFSNRRLHAWLVMAPGAMICLIGLGLVACGGGGSSSTSGDGGGNPVAPPPVCSSSIVNPKVQSEAAIRAHVHGSYRIPASTVEHLSDVGLRFHTNHLINTNPVPAIGGPAGLTPTQVLKAYNVPANGGSGAIAVVEAYDYPQALADFNVFSSQFGLPTENSSQVTSSSNQVFQVVYAGGTKPTSDPDWAQETALDAQWAHAMAPHAKIFVVEAASSSLDDLMFAVKVAKALPGVRQVSTSFGSTETGCAYVQYDSAFLQPGVSFFASAGDAEGVRSFPPGSVNVVAVGGTTLNVAPDGTRISETAWSGANGGTGCGPSELEPRPTFQNSLFSIVGLYRGVCDIAAVGDPQTGVSVYDSFPDQGSSGWIVVGGTSAGCPIIAGIANVSGIARASSQDLNAHMYAAIGTSNFNDIRSGSASTFDATTGWDFPTGVGTPNGAGGF